MKKNVTYVAIAKFEQATREAGLPWEEQKGFVKVQGPKGRQVYVAKTKSVGRVDISGFEVQFGAVSPHCGPFGNVKQQLDMSLPEADILTNYAALLEHMKGLEPVERKPRAISSPKPIEPTAQATGEAPAPTGPSELERLLKTKDIADRKGLALSPEVESRIAELQAASSQQ